MQVTSPGFIALKGWIQERGDEMLVDRQNAFFTPDRLVEKFEVPVGRRCLARHGIAANVVPGVLVRQQAPVRMHGPFKHRADAILKAGDIVLVAGDD